MGDHSYSAEVRRLGIPDRVVEHGEQPELFRECKFDAAGIEQAAIELFEAATRPRSPRSPARS